MQRPMLLFVMIVVVYGSTSWPCHVFVFQVGSGLRIDGDKYGLVESFRFSASDLCDCVCMRFGLLRSL